MESLSILFLNWRDIKNPEAGGAEIYTHEIAKRLVERGHLVTLFTSRFKNCKKKENIDGINIVRLYGKYLLYWKVRKYYNENRHKFDIIVDEINTIPFFTPKFAKREKIIALIHQLAREAWFYETPFPINLFGYYFIEYRWLKNYIDIPTITVSKSTENDLKSLGFQKIFIVYNGLNVKPLDKVPQKSEKPLIVYVGRMKKVKKPQDVIAAFKIIKKRIKNATLWMIGNGYLRKKLEVKAQDVTFFGYLSKEIKDKLVRKAWVIAVPGVREGWGQVVTDANALGVPAVGYDIPGLRDSIKNGYNGFLVKNNPKALANGIIRILINNKLRKKLSENAIKWAKRFSWDNSARRFEKIIKDLLLKE